MTKRKRNPPPTWRLITAAEFDETPASGDFHIILDRFPKRDCCCDDPAALWDGDEGWGSVGLNDPGDCPRCALMAAYELGREREREFMERTDLRTQPATVGASLVRGVPQSMILEKQPREIRTWILAQGSVGGWNVRADGHDLVVERLPLAPLLAWIPESPEPTTIDFEDFSGFVRDERKRLKALGK